MAAYKLICECCNEEFYGRVDAKTCSPKCKKARQRKNNKEKECE